MLWALHRLEEFNWNDPFGKDKAAAELNPFMSGCVPSHLSANDVNGNLEQAEATPESGYQRPSSTSSIVNNSSLVHNVLNAIDGRRAVGHEQNSRMSSIKGIMRVPLASLARSPRHSTFLPGHPAYRAPLPQRWSSSLSQKPGSAG